MEGNDPDDNVGGLRSPDIDIQRWVDADASQGEFAPTEPCGHEQDPGEPRPHTLAWLLAPAPDVVDWWLEEEHKESEIADLAQADANVAAFVAAVRSPRVCEQAATTAGDGTPTPAPSLAAQRLAYRRSVGTVPATRLAATRDVRGVKQHTLGRMDVKCTSCKAMFWIEERKPSSSKRNPVFETCCRAGAVKLQLFSDPPAEFMELLTGQTPRDKHYRQFIRAYNLAYGFTSSGANFDRSLANMTSGVYVYKIQGASYHLISDGLLPAEGQQAKFAQIYIFDTDMQNERRREIFPDLDEEVMTIINRCLATNPFVQQFQAHNVRELQGVPTQEFELRVGEPSDGNRQYDVPTGSEVAVLMPGDEDEGSGERSIVLHKHGGGVQFVNQLDPRFDSLHFILLFLQGSPGWSRRLKALTNVTMNQFYRYHLMVRDEARNLQLSGRLLQEYVVDAYAKIEQSRLMYIRTHHVELKAQYYQGLMDQVVGEVAGSGGRKIILPPSFTGGPRYMQALYQDAMAIVRKLGKPDFFITMTCNPKWTEITRELLPGQTAQDRFLLCCRVFHIKLKALLDMIVKGEIFGKVKGRVYVVEFQKRGLPHAHMLWIMEDEFKARTPEEIDRIVCAEIPDPNEDKELYEIVTSHMMHGPCGRLNTSAPCTTDDGVCQKKFPKAFTQETQVANDGYPHYRRRDNGRSVIKGVHMLDNRYVVPYNKYLLKTFNCHINVEICSSVHSVKYLYKYVYKGHDRIQAHVTTGTDDPEVQDEPKRYLDARYVSASEAYWRISEMPLQKMYPGVTTLAVHDENQQPVIYREGSTVGGVIDRAKATTLMGWMRYNAEHPEDELAKRTLYCDFPSEYTWDKSKRTWHKRKKLMAIGRVHFVSPSDTTRYYLRLLLHHVPGATCFKDLRTVDGEVCETYQRAAVRLGLLETDEEFDNDMRLAVSSASPRQVRELFAMLLMFCEISEPEVLLGSTSQIWQKTSCTLTKSKK